MLSLHRVPGRRASDGRRPDRLLFLVHGFARTAEWVAALGELLDPDRRFAIVAPRGSIVVAPEGASFYDVSFATKQLDEASFARAVDALDAALDEACSAGGFDRGSAVVGGFSQGAGLALALAFRRDGGTPPGAVVALSPPIHPPERVAWDLARTASTPLFLTHGTEDEVFPYASVEQFAHDVAGAGGEVAWHPSSTGHLVVIEALDRARDWLVRH